MTGQNRVLLIREARLAHHGRSGWGGDEGQGDEDIKAGTHRSVALPVLTRAACPPVRRVTKAGDLSQGRNAQCWLFRGMVPVYLRQLMSRG
jgi:hypothetical protein